MPEEGSRMFRRKAKNESPDEMRLKSGATMDETPRVAPLVTMPLTKSTQMRHEATLADTQRELLKQREKNIHIEIVVQISETS